jgi:hypothetical protein
VQIVKILPDLIPAAGQVSGAAGCSLDLRLFDKGIVKR